MEDFKGNSFAKQQEKKPKVIDPVAPVVSNAHVQVKKTSEFGKLMKSFFSKDIKEVMSDVGKDVLLPGLQRTFVDIVKNGVDMIVYGSRTNYRPNGVRDVQYSSYFNNGARVERNTSNNLQPIRSNVFMVNDITYDSKIDADNVLYTLQDLINKYHKASVEDFYNASNLKPNFTDSKWGWTDLSGAYVYLTMDRWAIKLPRAIPLE